MGEGGGCDSTATSTLVCTLVVWSCFRISISKYIVKKCPQFPGGPRIKWELRNLLVFTVSPIGFIFFIKNRNSHQMPIMASCCGNGIFSLPTLRTENRYFSQPYNRWWCRLFHCTVPCSKTLILHLRNCEHQCCFMYVFLKCGLSFILFYLYF